MLSAHLVHSYALGPNSPQMVCTKYMMHAFQPHESVPEREKGTQQGTVNTINHNANYIIAGAKFLREMDFLRFCGVCVRTDNVTNGHMCNSYFASIHARVKTKTARIYIINKFLFQQDSVTHHGTSIWNSQTVLQSWYAWHWTQDFTIWLTVNCNEQVLFCGDHVIMPSAFTNKMRHGNLALPKNINTAALFIRCRSAWMNRKSWKGVWYCTWNKSYLPFARDKQAI